MIALFDQTAHEDELASFLHDFRHRIERRRDLPAADELGRKFERHRRTRIAAAERVHGGEERDVD